MPPSNRTERLLNLVIALASTSRWLTKEQIGHAVPQYADCESPEAFDRMFERDKEDLRELGIPLMIGTPGAWFGDETGYRIDRESYALPAVDFTPAELGVLSLASRVWQQASLAGPAARAMVKLKALGVRSADDSLVGVEPRVRTTEPAFDPIYAATRDGAPISFGYRRPGQSETTTRTVEPWSLTSRGGWWYVIGFDRDRADTRVFRLSRIEGRIRRVGAAGTVVPPPDLEPERLIGSIGHQDERIAVLRVRVGRGVALRLAAHPPGSVPTALTGAHARPVADLGNEWDELSLVIGDLARLVEQVAAHGPDVVVLAPEDLRQAVIDRLRGALAAHSDVGGAGVDSGGTQ